MLWAAAGTAPLHCFGCRGNSVHGTGTQRAQCQVKGGCWHRPVVLPAGTARNSDTLQGRANFIQTPSYTCAKSAHMSLQYLFEEYQGIYFVLHFFEFCFKPYALTNLTLFYCVNVNTYLLCACSFHRAKAYTHLKL